MNRLIVAATLLALGTTNAMAADIAVKAQPLLPPAVATWTGFYAGLNAGYGWSDASSTNVAVDQASAFLFGTPFPDTSDPCCFLPGVFDTRFHQKGAMAGGQAGYNWQWSDRVVAGIEADLQWADVHGTDLRTLISPFQFLEGLPFPSNTRRTLEWFGTVRARLGFLATPNLLLYGTGGLAYGETNTTASISLNLPGSGLISITNGAENAFVCAATAPTPGTCYAGHGRETSVGWSGGLGGEWRFADKWSAKLEWLHIDLPGNSVTLVSPSPPSTPGVETRYNFKHQDYDFVRVGVNYQFGGPAAVVAKY